jgi:hypothetical protein
MLLSQVHLPIASVTLLTFSCHFCTTWSGGWGVKSWKDNIQRLGWKPKDFCRSILGQEKSNLTVTPTFLYGEVSWAENQFVWSLKCNWQVLALRDLKF